MKIQSSQAKAVEDLLRKPQALSLRGALWSLWGQRKDPACSRVWKYNLTLDCKGAKTDGFSSNFIYDEHIIIWLLWPRVTFETMCSSEEKKNTLFVEENSAGC